MQVRKYDEITTFGLLRMAVLNFPSQEGVPDITIKHLRRQWIRSMKILGVKWICHPSNSAKRKTYFKGVER